LRIGCGSGAAKGERRIECRKVTPGHGSRTFLLSELDLGSKIEALHHRVTMMSYSGLISVSLTMCKIL
jgi:hypothetical protein